MFESVVIITAVCTMYTASVQECGNSNGITASGQLASPSYTLAADHLPLGTKVKRLSDGRVYEIQDRFGANHTNKIDIFVSSRKEAINYGKRVESFVILPPEGHFERKVEHSWNSLLSQVFSAKGSVNKPSWCFPKYDI